MKYLIIILLTSISSLSFAQEPVNENEEFRTILGDLKSRSNGGYGEFSVKYLSIAQSDAFLHGGGGAWIFQNYFYTGFNAYSFNTLPKTDPNLGSDCRFSGGYGGINMGFIIFPRSVVHISIPIMGGAGVVSYMKHFRGFYDLKDWQTEDTEMFLFVEPGIELEINLLKFLRLSAGAHYIFTSNYELNYISDNKLVENFTPNLLEKITVGFSMKFGKF